MENNEKIIEEITSDNSKKASENKAIELIGYASQMSSKLSKVGRDIVIALMGGSWILLRFYERNPEYAIFIKLALVCAFLYLIIDFIYYGMTMINYYKMVEFDFEDSTIYVENNDEAFKKQAKNQKVFLVLAYIKSIILLLSVVFICLYIFL